MAPGLLLDHSKDNEANEQKANPDDRAEMTNRLSCFFIVQGSQDEPMEEFLLRGAPPTGASDQT